MTTLRVISAEGLTPETRRRCFEMSATRTVEEIVREALPRARESDLDLLRVTLMLGARSAVIPRARWRHVRPHAGTTMILRLVPGDVGGIGWVAQILTAQFYNLTGISSLGVLQGVYAASAGVAALGLASIASQLINALIPLPQQGKTPGNPEDRYSVGGWRNELTPGEPMPLPMGTIRMAPVFAATPYSEIIGNEQYVRAAFLFGYGRLDISDIRIGETSIDDFQDVIYEVREGVAGDDPLYLTPRQVLEDSQNLQLRRPFPRDAAGNIVSGPSIETPVVLQTASDATEASVIFHFPSGLSFIKDNGDVVGQTVEVRIRQRQIGGSWSTVTQIVYSGSSREAFFRQFTWTLPSRGRWQIEVTRITDDDTRSNTSRDIYLRALQSIRPEYPIDVPVPLALMSVRIRASYQLNGTIDSVNALVKRHVRDWDGTAWSEGLSRTPAAGYLFALQGPHSPYPVPDAGIDWDWMQAFHDHCVDKGLHYDRGRFGAMGLLELLSDICAAGRAAPRHDGRKWSGIIDTPKGAVTHITPRNSRNFRATRTYIRPPDGLRARFRDETNDYAEDEVTIAWPGHTGSIDVVEEISKPGKTNPDELATELYRTAQEIILRRDSFQVERHGAARTETRGDIVMLTHESLSDVQRCARVRAVNDALVVLDDAVVMEDGESYGLTWQQFDAADTVGQTVVSAVQTVPGELRALRVTGDHVPAVGDLVTFGLLGEITEKVLVIGIEPGRAFWSTVYMTNAAPELDALAEAYVPETWDTVIGEVIIVSDTPAAPLFTGVATEAAAGSYGAASRTVTVGVATASTDSVPVTGIVVEHRVSGVGSYTQVTVPGTSGTAELTYDVDTVLDLRAAARNLSGTLGTYTSVVNYTVGADAATLPEDLDLTSASATGGLGHALIALSVSDANTTQVQVFRTATGDALDTDTDALGNPISVPAGGAIAFADGDASRSDLLAATWTAGGGWGSATLPSPHSAGSSGTLSQALSLTLGETYRGQITVSGHTAGSVTVQLAGGTPVATSAIDADGQALFALTAVTGNDRIEVVATSDFDGQITAATLYLETASCVAQGDWDYRFAALNSDGVASATTSALSTTII